MNTRFSNSIALCFSITALGACGSADVSAPVSEVKQNVAGTLRTCALCRSDGSRNKFYTATKPSEIYDSGSSGGLKTADYGQNLKVTRIYDDSDLGTGNSGRKVYIFIKKGSLKSSFCDAFADWATENPSNSDKFPVGVAYVGPGSSYEGSMLHVEPCTGDLELANDPGNPVSVDDFLLASGGTTKIVSKIGYATWDTDVDVSSTGSPWMTVSDINTTWNAGFKWYQIYQNPGNYSSTFEEGYICDNGWGEYDADYEEMFTSGMNNKKGWTIFLPGQQGISTTAVPTYANGFSKIPYNSEDMLEWSWSEYAYVPLSDGGRFINATITLACNHRPVKCMMGEFGTAVYPALLWRSITHDSTDPDTLEKFYSEDTDFKACADPNYNSHCSDSTKNYDEGDADKGGSCYTKGGTGDSCNISADCESRICTSHVCVAPTCSDGKLNGGESDQDCGGNEWYSNGCSACASGKYCGTDSDCSSNRCDYGPGYTTPKTCGSCSDSVKNGSETDVDCGGNTYASWPLSGCGTCGSGKSCSVNGDCTSGVCNAGTCT